MLVDAAQADEFLNEIKDSMEYAFQRAALERDENMKEYQYDTEKEKVLAALPWNHLVGSKTRCYNR